MFVQLHVGIYLEGVFLYDPVHHVCRHLPQHCDHGNVGFTGPGGRTHKDVLVAAGKNSTA